MTSVNKPVDFGLRVPAFPLDGSPAEDFRTQLFEFLTPLEAHYDSAWVADHFIPWYTKVDMETPTLEAWTTLTFLAGRFHHYRLGNIVLSQSYRPPALLAKMGATLQWLSGGRFVLSIGAGWKEDEYRQYGYDFPGAAARIHQMEEAVQIIRKMWTEERASFTGEYYRIEDAVLFPKPEPLPPIMIGGGGKQLTLRVVAKHADWWNIPGGSPENYREHLEVLRGHCEAVGRDFASIRKTWANEAIAIAPTRAEAEVIADRSPFGRGQGSLVGTPDEVASQLKAYTDLSIDLVIMRFADFPDPEGAALFAREVTPRFR
jgi:alkanesulfonate monooxygenase SsuD/methylene tetrahydromethanopterin reductase-like flavin-dependent oxidoreductase (luciferase family)